VVTGFVLQAVGSLITLGRLSAEGYFSQSYYSAAQVVLSNLAILVTVWVWWWLTGVTASSDEQRKFLRYAFYGLALVSLLLAAQETIQVLQVPNFTRGPGNLAPVWVHGLGELLCVMGFVTLARAFAAPDDASIDAEVQGDSFEAGRLG